jgi:HPt (histidine-containing phosphotransfer) domain-containing protein
MCASDFLGSGPDSQADVIDEEHLRRMTLGDRGLERELLQIFVRQITTILDRIADHDPAAIATAAHTMIGSARSIGAWRLAKAAEQLQRAVGEGNKKGLDEAIAALRSASLEVSTAIDGRFIHPSRPVSGCA